MEIQDSIVLVTGANRGVGQEYVAQLIKTGAAKVYACARNPDSLGATVALDPGRVVPLQLDVTDSGSVEAAAQAAGDVNLLINNAGSLTFGGALEATDAGLATDMAVNNDGLRRMTQAFTPIIEANGGGAVVNMLTLLSFVSAPGFAGYNASKAAAWSMAMSLRAYLRPKGIQIINAFPAGIDTDMLAGVDAPKDSPEAVVRDVLAAVVAGHEDVYPASAADVFDAWRTDQKSVEAAFGEMM
ncbi:MAG: SDR family NAD(P)-dependent oxidoreductase [Pseudomonadota bacterium]|uniref:SDR family NAD(P)-dependent oxidoreductase n=1 Tax=Marivivens aquimaris TaxID=2774876 RepID=UPI001881057D|nr:SDR family NAD(P)-dependent oxidoreductase [Marivivens aquimaris]MEC8580481.1 SDR family NAD(P)-dependent oxidoreductase [Pseudomonadota bacterium]